MNATLTPHNQGLVHQPQVVPHGAMPMQSMAPIHPMAVATPMFGVTELKKRAKAIQEVMRGLMKSEVHYGVIPGTPKPSLFKPGAEMLCMAFQLAPIMSSRVVVDDPDAIWDFEAKRKNRQTGEEYIECGTCNGYFEVETVCQIVAPNGAVLAQASGRCNNRENKYRTLSVYDCRNTVQKMSEKRAFVAGTLMATGASDIFGQDLEDLADGSIQPTGAVGGRPSVPAQSILSPKQQEAARKFGAQAGIAPAVVEFAVAKVAKGEAKGFMDACFTKDNGQIKAAFEPFAAAFRAQEAQAADAAKSSAAGGAPPAGADSTPSQGGPSDDPGFPDEPQGAPSTRGGAR